MKKYIIELQEDDFEEIRRTNTIEKHLGTVDWAIRNAIPLENEQKLKEAIKDIKANMKSYCDANCPYLEKQREFMCKACMMGDAINMVDNYTEGLV